MANNRIKIIITLACLACQGVSCLWTAYSQERNGIWGVKAGAERMTVGSFRDTYTSLGFNSYTVEFDRSTLGTEKTADLIIEYGKMRGLI